MTTRTTSKNKEFVSVPRNLYEEFLIWEKTKNVKMVKPTKRDLEIIKRGEKAIKTGDYITLEELKKELGL